MKTGILFSGQGAQAVGMGKSFYEGSPTVRGMMDLANAVVGWELTKVCFEGSSEQLAQTSVCQPALYVHGFAAYTLLCESNPNLQVSAAAGLSLGELTALAAAGVFDFATGLKIVAERGRLMQEACDTTSGTMASVIGADREKVAELCRQFDIDMANLNSPGQTVISGAKEKVKAAVEAASTMGFKKVIPLNVGGAYHSRLMKPAAEKFERFLESFDFDTPRFPVLTNTTGRQLTVPQHPAVSPELKVLESIKSPSEIKAALVKQIYSPVLWEDCFRSAVSLGVEQFYECGMGGVLAGLAKRIDPNAKVSLIAEMKDLGVFKSTSVGA